jgi:hypothetical protein
MATADSSGNTNGNSNGRQQRQQQRQTAAATATADSNGRRLPQTSLGSEFASRRRGRHRAGWAVTLPAFRLLVGRR